MPEELYQLTKEQFAALIQLINLVGPSGELRKANTRYRDMLQKHTDLMEETRGILDRINIFDSILREFIEEASRELGDINRLLLLERTGNRESREAERVRTRMQRREDDSQLKELLRETQESLDKVQLQIARHGGEIDAPVKLIRQREELEAGIAKIKEDLGIMY